MVEIPSDTRPSGGTPDFGRFHLVRLLGEGGMASVFLAELEGAGGFSKKVALKLIHPHLSLQPEFTHWFMSEARLGGLLSHPNIVETLDFGEHLGRYYLAMEFVNGPSLHGVMAHFRDAGAVLPPDICLQLMIQVCHGLEYAHNATDNRGQPLRMVHRDLKPSNILISRHGVAKIGDFGVARAESNLTRTAHSGLVKGTVRYMSPEQAWGDRDLDHRSDLFAVGNILFELFTGCDLYEGSSLERSLRQAQDCVIEPRLAMLPESPIQLELREVLLQALAREPGDRFQSAGELAERLEALLGRLSARSQVRQWIGGLEPLLLDPSASQATLAVGATGLVAGGDTVAYPSERDAASALAASRGSGAAAGSGHLTPSLTLDPGGSSPPHSSPTFEPQAGTPPPPRIDALPHAGTYPFADSVSSAQAGTPPLADVGIGHYAAAPDPAPVGIVSEGSQPPGSARGPLPGPPTFPDAEATADSGATRSRSARLAPHSGSSRPRSSGTAPDASVSGLEATFAGPPVLQSPLPATPGIPDGEEYHDWGPAPTHHPSARGSGPGSRLGLWLWLLGMGMVGVLAFGWWWLTGHP